MRVVTKKRDKDWVTKILKDLIDEKNIKYKQFMRDPTNDVLRIEALKARNKTNKLVNKAREDYFYGRFLGAQSDIRQTWQLLNEVIDRKKILNVEETIIKNFVKNEKMSLRTVADTFADKMVNNVKMLIKQCSHGPIIVQQEINNDMVQLNEFEIPSLDEFKKILNSFKNKPPGYDNVKFQYLIEENVSNILYEVVRDSLEKGKVPDKMKVAIAKPIHKSGPKNDYENYRPIQNLPLGEKALEKIVLDQLIKHLNDNKVFNNIQFAYQKGKGTLDLLDKFGDIVNNALNLNKHVMALFVDYSKAFDVLSKDVILNSLRSYGVSGNALLWFDSYLTNRFISVKIGDVFSDLKAWATGAPQGSHLGPMCYILAINDIIKYFENLDVIILMFADDLCILSIHDDEKLAFEKLQAAFNMLQKYSHDKGLTINVSKTKTLHIRNTGSAYCDKKLVFHDHECLHSQNQNLGCNCNLLVDWVQHFKYLGLIIDDHLDWEIHTTSVLKKLRSYVYVFYKLRATIPLKVMKIVYHSLVESAISYGLTTYGKRNDASLKRIENLQNSIVKIMYSKMSQASETDILEMYRSLNLLPASKLFVYKLVLKYYFSSDLLTKRPESRTRNPLKYVEYNSYNKYGERSLKCLLPKIFNSLDLKCEKIKEVKIQLKKLLLTC